MPNVSTTGLTTQSILQLRRAQTILSELSSQLATGKKSTTYQDYSFIETKHLLDYNTQADKHTSYLGVINTVEPRLKLYETALTNLSKNASDTLTLVNTTQDYGSANIVALGEQFKGTLNDIEYYLNLKMGDRYIFSGTGTRYTTLPVQDLNGLPSPPAPADIVAVTSPTLPTYDTGAPGANAAAYAKESINVADGNNINYGITSNEAGIQNLVLGLRWAYAATQSPANFTAYMATARGLLTSSLPQIRDLQANVASNQNRVEDARLDHNKAIVDITNRADTIQHADSAEVSAKITFTQAQLEASYSVTARIAQLSITKYL